MHNYKKEISQYMIKQTIQNLVINPTNHLKTFSLFIISARKQQARHLLPKYSDLLKHGEDRELPLVIQHAVAHCLQQDHQASA